MVLQWYWRRKTYLESLLSASASRGVGGESRPF